MAPQILKTGIADCYVEDGILVTVFTVEEMTVDQLKAHDLAIKSHFGDILPLPSLVDSSSIRKSSKEVRDYGATEMSGGTIIAVAVILSSMLNKIMMNLFLTFSKPKYTIKAFSDKAAALKWLEPYKK
jgi:hypothetical protein